MSVIRMIEAAGMKADVPEFRPGDRVKVHVRVVEGDKSRIQVFEGDVISRRSGAGLRATFTVRKTSGGVGVERIFPVHAPVIDHIDLVRTGRVRRAKSRNVPGPAPISTTRAPDPASPSRRSNHGA